MGDDALRILIVEDEQDAGEIIESLLAHYHLETVRVPTGEDAYAVLQQQHYDAAIVDLFLPGMDGIRLIQTIRSNPAIANMPCIAITAYNSSTMRKEAMEAGYNRFYAKPINHAELSLGLRELLS
jgi:CheY-like chemotaxis protein